MRREWRIRGSSREVILVRSADATDEERASAISGSIAARLLSGWIQPGTSANARSTLLQVWNALQGEPSRTQRVDGTWLQERVADALRSGRLLAITIESPASSSSDSGDVDVVIESREPEEPPAPAIKTWIEIRLKDTAGNPVANEPYTIKLPSGVTRTGTLNFDGSSLIQDIDPGTCEVSFPGIDGREWERA